MPTQDPSADRYNAPMPAIPGVPVGNRRWLNTFLRTNRGALTVGLAALVVGGLVFGIHGHLRAGVVLAPAAAAPQQDQATPQQFAAVPAPSAPEHGDEGEIGAIQDLAKPWSSKAFTFTSSLTQTDIPAMIVRLPGAAPGRGSSYWAFSLTEPFGTCQLVYVTDTATLASQYGYAAKHPMVVDPCTQTVFDPAQLGERSDGAWIRGKIVQGGGLRPPMAIEISVRNGNIYADRME